MKVCILKDLLLIIPAYNEEDNIQRVVEDLIKNFSQYDYIIVNDGSKDSTADICREHGYNMVDLPINIGLEGAFQTGLKYAYRKGYKYVMQYDGDGQHKAEYIESMLNEVKKGYDIVIGSRFVNKKKGMSLRMIGSRLISLAIRLTTGCHIKDPTSGMRIYGERVISEFVKNINYRPEPDTLSYLLKNGARISEVHVDMEERTTRRSYLSITRSVYYMVNMLCSILFIQIIRKRDRKYVEQEDK